MLVLFRDVAMTYLVVLTPLGTLVQALITVHVLHTLHKHVVSPVLMLTHCGRVTQISVFTLQLCKTDDANLRF